MAREFSLEKTRNIGIWAGLVLSAMFPAPPSFIIVTLSTLFWALAKADRLTHRTVNGETAERWRYDERGWLTDITCPRPNGCLGAFTSVITWTPVLTLANGLFPWHLRS